MKAHKRIIVEIPMGHCVSISREAWVDLVADAALPHAVSRVNGPDMWFNDAPNKTVVCLCTVAGPPDESQEAAFMARYYALFPSQEPAS